MSREIKFRAYDDGKMIYSHNNSINTNNFQLKWFFEKIRQDAIIMQFTGLKDKNEKEIYEGDVVMHGIVKTKSRLEFIGGSFALNNEKTMHNTCIRHYGLDECEVIGNIYDNPNLLT